MKFDKVQDALIEARAWSAKFSSLLTDLTNEFKEQPLDWRESDEAEAAADAIDAFEDIYEEIDDSLDDLEAAIEDARKSQTDSGA